MSSKRGRCLPSCGGFGSSSPSAGAYLAPGEPKETFASPEMRRQPSFFSKPGPLALTGALVISSFCLLLAFIAN